jgi:hypothetical protein
VAASAAIPDPDSFVRAAGGAATPNELALARWWDACYGTLLRVIVNTSSYHHLADALGTWNSGQCGNIERAIAVPIRYNDIPDILFDSTHGEWLNEPVMALVMGGPGALLGYGDALARITDDVLACDCGAIGHEEAAELAMGTVLFELIHPRYRTRRQLACLSAADEPIRSAYAHRAPGARQQAAAGTILQPGNVMYSAAWQPLWTQIATAQTHGSSVAGQLARRAVRRSLSHFDDHAGTGVCVAAARSVLADCDRLRDQASLRNLAGAWCRFFDTVIDASVTDSTARRLATCEMRPLVGRIWEQDIVGPACQSPPAPEFADERLFMDMDAAFQRSFSLPPAEGFAIRRAFLGVVTSATELSGFNPFARLTDGPARLLTNAT